MQWLVQKSMKWREIAGGFQAFFYAFLDFGGFFLGHQASYQDWTGITKLFRYK